MFDNKPVWLSTKANTIVLAIHAQPGAKREGVVGEYNARLKIALTTPPVDGKANAALIKFLSKKLGVPRSNFTLISGDTSRDKRLTIEGLSMEAIIKALT